MDYKPTPGMTICKVCGRPFALNAEEHYVTERAPGSVPGIFMVGRENFADAFDCPHCGCQNVMQDRRKEACPCDYGFCGECCEEDSDSEDEAEETSPCDGKEGI